MFVPKWIYFYLCIEYLQHHFVCCLLQDFISAPSRCGCSIILCTRMCVFRAIFRISSLLSLWLVSETNSLVHISPLMSVKMEHDVSTCFYTQYQINKHKLRPTYWMTRRSFNTVIVLNTDLYILKYTCKTHSTSLRCPNCVNNIQQLYTTNRQQKSNNLHIKIPLFFFCSTNTIYKG